MGKVLVDGFYGDWCDDGAFLGSDLTVGARRGVKPAHQKSQKTLFNF